MEKQAKCKRTSRRLTRWVLRLPLGWRITLGVLLLAGIIAVTLLLVRVVQYVDEWLDDVQDDRYVSSINDDCTFRRRNGQGYITYGGKYRPALKHVSQVDGQCGDPIFRVKRDGSWAYYNVQERKLITSFEYEETWSFSEGLSAATGNDGQLHFIRPDGSQAFSLPLWNNRERYFFVRFSHGLCEVFDSLGRAGLINHEGQWIVAPTYERACCDGDLWKMFRGDTVEVLDTLGRTIIPLTEGHDVRISDDGMIEIWHQTRPSQIYSHEGELFMRQSCAVLRPISIVYSDDEYVRNPLVYGTDNNHLGLMDRDGHVLTDAIYSEIEAIDATHFRADYTLEDVHADSFLEAIHYVILDSRGRVLEQAQ